MITPSTVHTAMATSTDSRVAPAEARAEGFSPSRLFAAKEVV